MRPIHSRLMLIAGATAMLASLGACTRVRTHSGYQMDTLVVNSVAAGIDNKASVRGALGTPTFTSQFGPEIWYYVSRDMKSLAYRMPRPDDQTILGISFDPAGNVAKVDRIGMEYVEHISPAGDKTPTLGRERGFFEQIFGNIGTVGSAGGAGGAGGPGGGTTP